MKELSNCKIIKRQNLQAKCRLCREFDRAYRTFGRYSRPYNILDTRSFLEDEFDSFIEPAFSSIKEAPRRLSNREPDENITVYAQYEINDNGHVWKKTIEKEPGKEWKAHIEESRGKSPSEVQIV